MIFATRAMGVFLLYVTFFVILFENQSSEFNILDLVDARELLMNVLLAVDEE